MATNYEIVTASPQELKISIRYYKDECPDYWVNCNITDFSEDHIHRMAEAKASLAERFWQDIEALPDSVELSASTGTVKEKVLVDMPEFDEVTQNVELSWTDSETQTTQTWTVTDKPDDDKAVSIRAKRDALLRDTDHHGLSDVTMSEAMTTYRQALRDIPQQSGFPASITWPTEP